MSITIDEARDKCERGFTPQYKKTFEGAGRGPKDKAESIRKFRANYDNIDWGKK